MFAPASTQVNFPDLEEGILQFWREHQTFSKSLKQRENNEKFVFFDGPPFATGLPHYGHLLAGTIKDVIPRYQTMKGKYVPRVFGWDCHGLPVEAEVEKELGIASKHEIENYGISNFNEYCRNIVLRYTNEWETLVERTGRWVDFENGYRTMDRDYMESIWWVFKQLWDRGLIYEGNKILPYCPRCATPLSNFEANQNYESVQDPSITVCFELKSEPGCYLLAWTTTPWTLPSNTGLAVGPEIEYVRVHDAEDNADYILASDRLEAYYGKQAPQIKSKFPGSELADSLYVPLFPYFSHLEEEGGFRVVTADFVSTEGGTGIVHVAPGFGEDDAEIGHQKELPLVCPVNQEGKFTEEVSDHKGQSVKETDRAIIRQLKENKKLVHQSTYQHNYPHCWRCESPLIYRAVSTWFVQVEAIKDRLLEANQHTHWIPEHIRDGRFGKWLENAHDWAISRNRYWGCPLPLWRSEDGQEIKCIGSIEELEKLSGEKFEDIHKHIVDQTILPSENGQGALQRVPEVLDCWFESGSMPYAQNHYPFENKENFEQNFPADFIAEGLDQTRGWFYTLMVISSAFFEKPAFRNVVVNGLVLAADGRKMSKRLKNYPEPVEIMNKYGADALRLCLINSPAVRAEDLRFSEEAVQETIRSTILPLWNAYTFLVTYARVDNYEPDYGDVPPPANVTNELDRWILSRLQSTVLQIQETMDNYKLQPASNHFSSFLDDLTNWYIRRSRRRFWKTANDEDKLQAYATLHYVLITCSQLAAPFIPFVTEEIYRNLKTSEMPESVHLTNYPGVEKDYIDENLENCMQYTLTSVTLGRYLRSQNSIKTRQPLNEAVLVTSNKQAQKYLETTKEVIAEELNVKNVTIREGEEDLVYFSAKPNYPRLGPRLGKLMKKAAHEIQQLSQEDIQKLRNDNTFSLTLDDNTQIELESDDVTIERHEKEGLTVANEGDITVALDTTITSDLKEEGIVRELINRVQNLRKEADLDVSDRIRVLYDIPEAAANALKRFSEHFCDETLAKEIQYTNLPDCSGFEIEGMDCKLKIEKL